MLVKLEICKIETGEVVATNYIVTDSPQQAMAMISEAADEDVKYHICDEDEERTFWASQMGKVKSEAKAAAARENGRKGGRPRKVADWVICPDCGEEYNRFGPGHECDPRVLAQIEADRKADEEVRASDQ